MENILVDINEHSGDHTSDDSEENNKEDSDEYIEYNISPRQCVIYCRQANETYGVLIRQYFVVRLRI